MYTQLFAQLVSSLEHASIPSSLVFTTPTRSRQTKYISQVVYISDVFHGLEVRIPLEVKILLRTIQEPSHYHDTLWFHVNVVSRLLGILDFSLSDSYYIYY